MMGRILAMLTALAPTALGGFLCLWGGFVASRVFVGYKDSPDSTYILVGSLVGSLLIVPGLIVLVFAAVTWRLARQAISEHGSV